MPYRTALFIPNLIGYARVLLTLVGYGCALSDWRITFGCYFISQGLDAADGFAARLLGQHSSFGAVLDMVTDRASTTCLCIVLGHLYPHLLLPFCCLVTLDMFSHWYHMYASLKLGLGSHKQVENGLLRLYYWKPVLFVVCAGTEFWYMSMYVAHFLPGNPLVQIVWQLTSPICVFKQIANIVQMYVAVTTILKDDDEQHLKRQ
ncbi:hypothetical protein AB1Y20_012368 [Prymnesium parvum]|uniref:CDP-diacylglycerol--inositol 3-phosphatidyltransferase n=1 Tax=Prymnesium parvum TaxID=97485 RepID=A0AB34INX1_PRYPA|eukprot:CAMPEP_0113237430 /NCGR_PEP_ID=MMETSP0008_2-20120614/4620_1 /TAXON_ID=97485 /ORGANISM="Prymnesium parvum" /LENGTH=203 /DNA_ID=CAMNT_0000084493 /DNA_START=105 /DNA_END=716 /DNA_ORIENTATION=+ /assembly_acc=CAM_ASM_000153